jgi:formate hydrogenlyase subunit 3/multisubunit Na+/H+ antiporter MnhD subunit
VPAAADSVLIPLGVLVPLVGGLLAFFVPRAAAGIGTGASLANLVVAAALALRVGRHGSAVHEVGGWGAPLGIDLHADGLAAAMLLTTGVVAAAVSLYATRSMRGGNAIAYWPLWLFLVTALNALFLSRDLFNLYVTLELLGLSAVALTALEGGREPLLAALRYLLASLAGSLAYLLGVALVYHAHGSVDIATAGSVAGPAAGAALVLMTVGLLLKAALFPFHFWLPAAHGSAAAPVSAALSGLVLKGAFFVLIRLWLEVFPGEAALLYGPLCWLGAAAVVWGSLQAIFEARIKLLIAYSTVAQIGYLFLALPLATGAAGIWSAILLLAAAHALAKTALFLAAGNLLSVGHGDRLDDLGHAQRSLPVTSAALGIAGMSIMGLPPTGGFAAKWLLLESAIAQQRWLIAGVLVLGGLLSAVYVFRLVERIFFRPERPSETVHVPAPRELSALALALLALALGFGTLPWLELVSVGGALDATGVGP